MIRSRQGRPLSEDVIRTSRTRSGTSSRLWQEWVRTSWVGSVSHLPLRSFPLWYLFNLLRTLLLRPHGSPRAGIRWPPLAICEAGPSAGWPWVLIWIPSNPSAYVTTPLILLGHSSSSSASSCSSILFTFASSSDNLSFSFYGFLNTLNG